MSRRYSGPSPFPLVRCVTLGIVGHEGNLIPAGTTCDLPAPLAYALVTKGSIRVVPQLAPRPARPEPRARQPLPWALPAIGAAAREAAAIEAAAREAAAIEAVKRAAREAAKAAAKAAGHPDKRKRKRKKRLPDVHLPGWTTRPAD